MAKPKFLRFIVFLGIGYLLYRQISLLDFPKLFWIKIKNEFSYFYFILATILVIPNYILEIIKWKELSSQIEKRSFSQSSKEVLRGLKLGILTPLMIGDYLGRSMDFKKENKGNAYVLNFFNSITQTWTALLFGSISIIIFYLEFRFNYLVFPIFLISIFTILGLLFIYNLEPQFLHKFKFVQNFISSFAIPKSLKTKIVIYSLLRTLIYNLQYILFYKSFNVILPTLVYFTGVNIILLIKTIGGGLNAFGDLSLREFVSLNFFQFYDVDQRVILIATFVVWFINVFCPIIFGIIYRPKP